MKIRLSHGGQYAEFRCPGCDSNHMIGVKPNNPKGWEFNGDLENPTFSPSILVRSGHYVPEQPQPPNCEYCIDAGQDGYSTFCSLCHSYIRDGQIQFLGDCTHDLAGKTVPLPEFPFSEVINEG